MQQRQHDDGAASPDHNRKFTEAGAAQPPAYVIAPRRNLFDAKQAFTAPGCDPDPEARKIG